MLRKIGAATFAAVLLASPALADNCSGTTTTGSTAAYGPTGVKPNGVTIMNRSANMICIAFDVAATMGATNCGAGSFALQPGSSTAAGGSYTSPASFRPATIFVISTAGGDAFSCTKW